MFRRILLPDECKPNLKQLRESVPPTYRYNEDGVRERVVRAKRRRRVRWADEAGERGSRRKRKPS